MPLQLVFPRCLLVAQTGNHKPAPATSGGFLMTTKPVIFICKRSNNRVSFTSDHDIESMRKHEGYVELKDESAVPPTEQPKPETKPRGRPRKGN